MAQGVHHGRHRQAKTFSESQRLRDSDIAAGHKHLIDRFHLLPTPHGPEVMDGAANGVQDRTGTLKRGWFTSGENGEGAGLCSLRPAGDWSIDVMNPLLRQLICGSSGG